MPFQPPVEGPRATARRLQTIRIIDAAELQLAAGGPAALSLRAIARDLGMASSAVYRYFASADDLLTELILRAYSDLGEAAERAGARGASPEERFMAICHACREWALAQPHRYALIYGSPVPAYHAPQSTVEQASRVGLALMKLMSSGERQGAPAPAADALDPGLVRRGQSMGVPGHRLPGAAAVWSQLYGLISFELFGHFDNVVSDRRSFFDSTLRTAWQGLVRGYPAGGPSSHPTETDVSAAPM